MSDAPQKVSLKFLIENYEVLLIDAYGVLMNSEGALPGAVDFIELLNTTGKPYFILSNGSLYNAEQSQGNYARRGFKIPKERIISSGTMIPKWVEKNKFRNKKFLVLGPEPTKNLIRDAGGLITANEEENPDVLVLGHQTGYDLLAGLEHAITLVLHSIEKAKPLPVLVPNPDVIFPKSANTYGITAGALALVLSKAVELRYPDLAFKIDYLGKPYASIFEEARSRAGAGRMLMIGDQMETDIRGSSNFGIDSALIGTGISKLSEMSFKSDIVPTYILDGFLSGENL